MMHLSRRLIISSLLLVAGCLVIGLWSLRSGVVTLETQQIIAALLGDAHVRIANELLAPIGKVGVNGAPRYTSPLRHLIDCDALERLFAEQYRHGDEDFFAGANAVSFAKSEWFVRQEAAFRRRCTGGSHQSTTRARLRGPQSVSCHENLSRPACREVSGQ